MISPTFYNVIRTNMANIVTLKSALNKFPGMESKIDPCKNPKTGLYEPCIRNVDSNGDMILSESDREAMTKNHVVFLPANKPITIYHGIQFDLDNPLQKAQWDAIKYSKSIAQDRTAKDAKGNLIIDGGPSKENKYHNPQGRYGMAEFYIEREGVIAQAKNDFRKLRHQAEDLVLKDNETHQRLICRLFGRDMKAVHPQDMIDYLLSRVDKEPETVIKYYNTEESAIRLLLLEAVDKGVVTINRDGYYFSQMRLGANMDNAVDYLKLTDSKPIREAITKDTFPDLKQKVKDTKKSA